MSIKVIGFDFDGVIIDTTEAKSQCFLELFNESACVDKIKKYEEKNQSRPRSEKISEVLLQIFGKNDLSELQRYLDRYKNLLSEKLILAKKISGVDEFINKTTKLGIIHYIVSSAPQEEIEHLLVHHKIRENFLKIYDFKIPKSKALNSIISDYGISSREIIFLGDQPSDLKAAKEVGCQFVGINPSVPFSTEIPQFKDFTFFDWKLLQ